VVALRTLLRLPLFAKLLVANGAIVVGAVVAAQWVGSSAPGEGTLAFPVIVVVGLLGILAGNAVILWVALAPLRNLHARVPDTPLADREMRRLVQTFNDGLAAAARQRQRLRGLQLRETSANEAERERVALLLHDGVAQELTALRIRARLALASTDSQLRDAVLREVSDGIGDVVHDVRGVATRLRPLGLQLLGLGVAIESRAKAALEAAGIAVTIRNDDVHGLLSPETELVLYRVAEEALSNIVQHSAARYASITLRRRADQVVLLIEDDGVGFEPGESDVSEFGLFEMQERVAAAGGLFELDSARGHGVRIQVLIPIECTANV
jgi:two-component system sensor histidine kinase UhpB